MMRILTITAIILLIGFILIQLYPVEKPAFVENNPDDLIINSEIPANIKSILKTSCYDCHSNETIYPWYSNIAPVKWLVYKDIIEGRKAANFSNWAKLSDDDKMDLLYDMAEEVQDGDMPMAVYIANHSDAKLDSIQKNEFSNWAESLADEL